MLGAPFREFFPLIVFNDNLNLPQDLFAALADRCSQLTDSIRGVEVENAQEVLMFKIGFRLQTAAGHQGVGHADGGGVAKGRADVEIIILFQKRTVNGAENIVRMVVPILTGKLNGDTL